MTGLTVFSLPVFQFCFKWLIVQGDVRAAEGRILHFPSWEILPYDRLSPHRGTSFERLSVLGRLSVSPAKAASGAR